MGVTAPGAGQAPLTAGPGLASLVLLLGAVAVVSWPAGTARRRRRRLRTWLVAGAPTAHPLRVPRAAGLAVARWAVAAAASAPARPGGLLTVAVVAAGGLGTVAAGPVAGAVFAAYGGLAAQRWVRGRRARWAARRRTEQCDALSALAGDLRAGQAPPTALAGAAGCLGGTRPRERLGDLLDAARLLAERTGAPLAELVERIEKDARAAERLARATEAQAAGARATAWLLTALPLGGVALGHGIGADPLAVLLGTPLGAGCALAAVALQLAGLRWTDHIVRIT